MLKKEYKKDDLTVIWKPELCYHSKNCVKNLPEVFRSNDKPWIQPEHAEIEEIKATIKKCPSGALSYNHKGEEPHEKKNDMADIETMKDGPVLVKGNFTLKVGGEMKDTGSQVVALCRCGASDNKPFCDGSHKGAGFKAD